MVLHVLRRDARMRAWYCRIKRRRGSKIARVAVMRRLATIIWHMVKHNEPYVIGGPPPRKLRGEGGMSVQARMSIEACLRHRIFGGMIGQMNGAEDKKRPRRRDAARASRVIHPP